MFSQIDVFLIDVKLRYPSPQSFLELNFGQIFLLVETEHTNNLMLNMDKDRCKVYLPTELPFCILPLLPTLQQEKEEEEEEEAKGAIWGNASSSFLCSFPSTI